MKLLKKKKKNYKEELRVFEKMSVSNYDQESNKNSSSKEGEIIGSGKILNLNINYIRKN